MPTGVFLGPATSPEAANASGRRLRVVVIDDSPDAVMMLLTLLRSEGHEARGFGSGREALKYLQQFDPDVVISDIAMPQLTGWDLAREVRRTMGESRPMLIAISGRYTKVADKALGETAGYKYYLTKPYDPNVLLALIKQAPTK